ncbi:MAG: glucose-6-phosphate isomerase, partial [Sphingomonadaceae bacterium]|nr:glucose-6-phosphate isomerase [Sphingomonadaceae bacterium]
MADAVHAAWGKVRGLPHRTLADLFADPARVEKLTSRLQWGEGETAGGVLFDWSKTHLDDALLDAFEALAGACDFSGKRAALLSGARINVTEGRAAEHTAQRGVGADASVEEAMALHARMRMLVEAIHEGALGEVKHLIHIGIGGSALGPKLAIDALTRDLALV